MHKTSHPLAGKTVKIIAGEFKGKECYIVDWYDKIVGMCFLDEPQNSGRAMLIVEYMERLRDENHLMEDLMFDWDEPVIDEVVYTKIDNLGKIMHVDQLSKKVKEDEKNL